MTEFTLPVRVARSFIARARGLLFSERLPDGTALVLPATSAVHGLLMNRPLDLAFLSADGEVLATAVLPPGRLRWHRGAASVLEFESGQIALLGLQPGDRIRAIMRSPEGERAAAAVARREAARVTLLGAALLGVGLPGGELAASPNRPETTVQGRQESRLTGSAGPAASSGPTASTGPAASAGARLPAIWIARFADRAEKLYQSGADDEALAAFATWLDADPGAEAIVILRVGNLHQRNGRDWLAIDSYRRALDLVPANDPMADEARRKALVNLEGLLEAVSHRLAEVLGPGSGSSATPASPPGPRGAPRALPVRHPAPSNRAAPALLPVATPTRPTPPHRSGAPPGSTAVAPTVEYLGQR